MKKTFFLLAVLSLAMVSCKNSEEKPATENDPNITEASGDNSKVYRGEFIYQEGQKAGVLMGNNFIYGVTLDEMTKALASQVAVIQKEKTDMVPVVVKGVVTKNPDVKEVGQGWAEVITITEIVAVSDKPSEADIKIEETKN